MGLRKQKRTPLRTQVRIFGTDVRGNPFTRLVETVDVSPSGVRLAGVYLQLREGDEVNLEADSGLGHYRVVWIGKLGTAHAGEIGLRSIDASVVLWPTDDPQWVDTYGDNTKPAPRRRFYRRFPCDLVAYATPEGQTVRRLARCTDLSFGGCYLETKQPLEVDAKLSLTIYPLTGPPLQAAGFVRTSSQNIGMGVRFTLVEEPRILAALLDSLREANPAEHGKPVTLELPATEAKIPVRLRTSVLIADDSLASRGMIAQQLRRHGYSVTLAKDGEEALQVAKSRQPDLILLDILMPKLSGLAVLRRLKSDATTRDIPVVVLSSLAEENDARVLAEGACGYIAKSHTSPEQLPIVVERTFEHLLATRQLQH